ncbi:MAG: YdeI/OmpD-associated family protein [Chloroflexota bacterium]
MSDTQKLHFTFTAQLKVDDTVEAGYMKHYLPVPQEIGQQFADADIKHLEGCLNTTEFRRVLHQETDNTYALKFGLTWIKRAGFELDTDIAITLFPDPDPERVDMPVELIDELQREPEIFEAWAQLTTGRQKTYAHMVRMAKQSATRQRRSRKIAEELRGTL